MFKAAKSQALREAVQMANVVQEHPLFVQQAKTHVVTHHPFFSSILLKFPLVQTFSVPTAGVTARGVILYNPEWLGQYNPLQAVFLLCHECMHPAFHHGTRRGSRDFVLWNQACDAVINELLKHMGVGEPIYPGIYYPDAHLKTSEEMYEIFRNEPPTPQDKDGNPVESGSSDGDPESSDEGSSEPGGGKGQASPCGAIGLDIIEEDLTEDEAREVEVVMNTHLRAAQMTAKQMGKGSALIDEIVDRIANVPTPWYELLSRFMLRRVEDDYTFAEGDRRYLSTMRMLFPTLAGEAMGKVILISDESGSISSHELQHFSGNMNKILGVCLPEQLYLVHCSHRVGPVDVYGPDDFPVDMSAKITGGTDMTAGIKWAVDNHPDAACIVVLTDGYTPFGEDPGIPTFWAITTDVVPPWGEHVKLDTNQ